MTRGPERQRLDAALADADEGVVTTNGILEWMSATDRLQQVSGALRTAANSGLGIGGRTGPAMFKAMRRSADNLDERIALFNEGRAALASAATTIQQVREQRDRIDTDPATAALPDPGSFSDDPEWDDEKRMSEQGKHNAAATAFAEREALREQRAREIAEQFDRRYDEPIAVMKRIHGLPDPEEPGGGDGRGGGEGPGSRAPVTGTGGPGTLTGTHPDSSGPDRPDRGPDGTDPLDPIDPIDGGTEEPTVQPPYVVDPLDPTGPTTLQPVGTGGAGGGLVPGGVGTAVGVGLGGGALLGSIAKGGALLRGMGAGVLAGGQQTRPLGGLSRSAVSGTLGRGAAAGAPATTRPAARGGVGAASSAGRTTSGRTAAAAGAGARTGAAAGGGRAGAAAGGARRRGRGRDGADHEHYDDGQDWLDDEAAPGVLD